jgi:hypothetical protein
MDPFVKWFWIRLHNSSLSAYFRVERIDRHPIQHGGALSFSRSTWRCFQVRVTAFRILWLSLSLSRCPLAACSWTWFGARSWLVPQVPDMALHSFSGLPCGWHYLARLGTFLALRCTRYDAHTALVVLLMLARRSVVLASFPGVALRSFGPTFLLFMLNPLGLGLPATQC